MLLEFQERMIIIEEWWNFVNKGDYVWVTYFKQRSGHKYTRVTRGRDGVEIKSMIDLVLWKRNILRYVQFVRAVRGMGPLCCTV